MQRSCLAKPQIRGAQPGSKRQRRVWSVQATAGVTTHLLRIKRTCFQATLQPCNLQVAQSGSLHTLADYVPQKGQLLWLPTGTETAEELLERASSNGNGAAAKKPFDGRAFRRALGRTGRYQRNPVNDPASLALMEEHGVGYSSTGLIAQMRLNGNLWQQGVRPRAAVQGPCTRTCWPCAAISITPLGIRCRAYRPVAWRKH